MPPVDQGSQDTLAATPSSEGADSVDATLPASAAGGYDALPAVDPDHYGDRSVLTSGGMGRIFTAFDKRLHRKVAIKELRAQTPDLRLRFQREALLTARLEHPNIVSVHEAGTWPSGEPFYAMRLVPGRPLDQAIAEAETLAKRLALLPHVIAVADALAYAHQERVIHRDLKPHNVMIGAFGETVVIDWGLGKSLDEREPAPGSSPSAAPGVLETQAGEVMGTPAYMPPEQAVAEGVDERADVYALGAILYHTLSGRPPYAECKTAAEVLARLAKGPPAALGALEPKLPADLLTIVGKAMHRDLGSRYPDAAELAEDLRRFTAGQLVAAYRYSAAERVTRWLRRHLAASLIATVAIATLTVYATWSFRRIDEERRGALAAARLADDRLTTSLTELGRSELLAGHAIPALAYLGEAMRRGADSPALREMIAIASRAWPAEIAVVRDGHLVDIAATTDGSIAAIAADGTLSWRAPDGKVTATTSSGTRPTSGVQATQEGGVVVLGLHDVAIFDAAHGLTSRIDVGDQSPRYVALGPAPDEVTVVGRDDVAVYGRSGGKRRSVALRDGMEIFEAKFEPRGTHLAINDGATISLVDLRSMAVTTVSDKRPAYLDASRDGSTFGFLEHGRVLHVRRYDGTEIATIQLSFDANHFTFSNAGDRIAVASDETLAVYDDAGALRNTMPLQGGANTTLAIRGDEVWSSGNDGVVRHFVNDALVASLPVATSTSVRLVLAGDVIAILTDDGGYVQLRADAAQLRIDPDDCGFVTYAWLGEVTTYTCRGGGQRLYVGRAKIAELSADDDITEVAWDEATGRVAVSDQTSLSILESDGRVLARTPNPSPVCFEDGDHVLAFGPHDQLLRWTHGSDRWEPVATVANPSAIAATATSTFVGTTTGDVVVLTSGQTARTSLGDPVIRLTISGNQRWIAATLSNGEVAILDHTGALARTLPPGDSEGLARFDVGGDLLLRTRLGAIVMSDAATGEDVVGGLDLLADQWTARFLPDGRLEVAGRHRALLDIRPDRKPSEQIVRDIDARVPLRVLDGRLAPVATSPAAP